MAGNKENTGGKRVSKLESLDFLGSKAILIGVGAVLILLGVTVGALSLLLNQTSMESANQSIQDIANAQARSLNNQTNLLTEHMQDIAKKHIIIESLQKRRLAKLHDEAGEIKDDNSYVLEAYIIPHGHSGEYALRFAELDQVRQTEKGKQAPPEAIEADGEWYFIISVPVKDMNKNLNLGTLFMSYDFSRLKQNFSALRHPQGSASLVQVFENTPPRIVFTDGDFAADLKEDKLVRAGNTRWHVLFTPGPDFVRGMTINPMSLMAILGSLGLMLSIVIILLLRTTKKANVKKLESEDRPIQISAAKSISNKKAKSSKNKDDNVEEEGESESTDSDEFNTISDPLFQHSDILDIEVIEEDTGVDEEVSPAESMSSATGDDVIYRAYDIRGNAEQYISDDVARGVGMAIGSEALSRDEQRVAVAADGRTTSPRIKAALIEGILSSGCHVTDIGEVPTPLMYFVTATTEITSGVMVTASHNPAEDNGFKIVMAGKTFTHDDILKIKARVDTQNFNQGQGKLSSGDYTSSYVEQITADIALAGNLKVVIDCANGIAGTLAPTLLDELGCDVVPLYCDVDGTFPNHDPDPSVMENLQDLVAKVKSEGADLGIALDGDGDRLVAVSPSGVIMLPDRLLMLFAKDIVSRNPGSDVIYDIKCTRRLNNLISGYGGRPLMWKSGHSNIKAKMLETGALLGGELSGHIFFKERWYGFDDGLYATARLLEILTIRDQDLDAVFSTFPTSAITPEILVPISEEKKFEVVAKLIESGDFSGGKMTTLDGLRVDFAKGWGLVRASNTSPHLTLRFEADNDDMLEKIKDMFKQQISAVAPKLSLNF